MTERDVFTLKLSEEERALADKLKDHFGEPIAVIVRRLLREKARELGLSIPPAPKRRAK